MPNVIELRINIDNTIHAIQEKRQCCVDFSINIHRTNSLSTSPPLHPPSNLPHWRRLTKGEQRLLQRTSDQLVTKAQAKLHIQGTSLQTVDLLG